jgi:hypothetical protein
LLAAWYENNVVHCIGASLPIRVLTLALSIFSITALAQPADVIFYHGKIITVDSKFRIADSLAIHGDRIIAVGDEKDLEKLAGPNTRKIDLNSKVMMPGLTDSHVHASEAAMYEWDHAVPEMETIADVLRYIKSRASVAKPGDRIVLRQVFVTRLRGQRFPTRAELGDGGATSPMEQVKEESVEGAAAVKEKVYRFLERKALRGSSDCRQPRHPQTSQSAHMADAAAKIPDPQHVHLLVVAQLGRTLVCVDHAACDSPWLIPQPQGIGREKIDPLVRHYNRSHKPFVWTATARFRPAY